MGVAGLWEVLRPAGQVRSLTELAVEDGFNANPSCQRGFRIGIDASIWFFHAAYGREGENPELRTLFFRCCRLLQSPLLPLFVFDGPNRPAIKRGKRVGGNVHWLTQGMKNIIDAFGFEWRVASGEAEAELAYLNRVGIIDAVLSDDVDNFLFGATMVIRNPSNTLSGNRAHPVKNAQGKDDGNHVVTYTAEAILSNPSVAMSRSGTILIGLLSGGDYIPAGLPGCGQKFATGLARAGFGDSLVKAVKELKGARLDDFLIQWRQDIRNELKTNKSGLLPSKKPSLAASLPDDFPSLPVLVSYTNPITSENTSQRGERKPTPPVWRNDPDPKRIASLCELYFEWGVKDVIVHRFRTVLWPGVVCRAVRRAVIDGVTSRRPPLNGAPHPGGEEGDAFEFFSLSSLVPLSSPSPDSSSRSASPSSPTSGPSPLLLEVLSQRSHVSTDSTLEFRVLIDPTALVERAESGVKGLRPPLVGGLFGIDTEDEDEENGTLGQDADESGSDDAGIERLETAAGAASKSGVKKRKARREVPTAPLRLWLPACMIRAAAPALAEAYDEKVRVREEKKAKRGTKGTRGQRAGTSVKSTSRRTKLKADTDDESVPGPSSPKTVARWKAKGKTVRAGGGRGRRKPKQASEAQDDAYECIDLSAGEGPCSSDREGVEGNTKGKGKARARETIPTKATTKTRTQADVTNRKVTAPNTMNEFFNTTKPSTAKRIKSKPFASRPFPAKNPTLNPTALTRVCEEEDSTDTAVPLPLPKSSRPLELLRAKSKSKPGTAAPNLTSESKSKSTVVPRYEEEESSSSSLPTRPSGSKPKVSSLPCRPVQQAPRARKKPLFVYVSDDSDIEVIDVRRPLSGTAATIDTHGEVEGKASDLSMSVGAGKPWSAFMSEMNMGKAVIGSRSKSTLWTSMTATSLPPVRPVSAPIATGTIGPPPIAQSLSKLGHIIFPQSTSESGEEGSEGDELPTFHHGSGKSRAKKKATVVRPAPRPFPMQLVTKPPVSPSASSLKERNESKHGDLHDDDDMVEIVDVFTTPRGPSPPRSPTPSPSPVKPLPVHASTRPSTFVRSSQSSEFPTSPTKSDTDPCHKTRQRFHTSEDGDTPISGNERNSIHKSPRKSAGHSSPRHVQRASSPTPLVLPGSASHTSNVSLWTGDTEGWNASDRHRPQLEESGGGSVGRKPRLSGASAIYISSGSEDEDNVVLSVDRGPDGGEAEVNDGYTDQDANTWADTGMMLSAPPSPAPPASDVPTIPPVEVVLFNPVRVSKFKPALTATSKVDMHAPSTEPQTSAKNTSTSLKGMTKGEDDVVPRPVRRPPLLIARAKRNKGRDDDIIDLTSD
ncbi:hypothetical protein L210DRAFT_3450367 [Boletus edulis BED1]|uniref:XPG-I domain-containing protein n=1 Tax=Boletus edulis BED1 TaxID=1328754 RepID=A0AAD4BSM8_BOLED|nr:hypothetical protein L210DRAFT_3450367 [Boletus edulis BED1]